MYRKKYINYINSELCVVNIIFSISDVRTIHTWLQEAKT